MSTEFQDIFTHMIAGEMDDAEICHYLVKWEKDGTGRAHLQNAARILRAQMLCIEAPQGAIDIVGTGGDSLSTYNISTATAFVVAGLGVPVAKHGNRAVSSQSGASDVLRALGVKLDIDQERTEACLQKAGIAFLFAPNHHKAMANVAKARAMLGQKSIFNKLGPLLNPAKVKHYLLGVYSDELRDNYAKALRALGTKHALIVHGLDGMDEITTTAPTKVSELNNGHITEYEICPEDFGLKRTTLKELAGGHAGENAKAMSAILDGAQNPYADIVALNAGAALFAADKVSSIKDGVALAQKSLRDGLARKALENLKEETHAK